MDGALIRLPDGRLLYISVFDRRSQPVLPTEPVLPVEPATPLVKPPARPPTPDTLDPPPDIYLFMPPGPRLSSAELETVTSLRPVVIEVDLSAFEDSSHMLLDVRRFVHSVGPLLPTDPGRFLLAPQPDWPGLSEFGITSEDEATGSDW